MSDLVTELRIQLAAVRGELVLAQRRLELIETRDKWRRRSPEGYLAMGCEHHEWHHRQQKLLVGERNDAQRELTRTKAELARLMERVEAW